MQINFAHLKEKSKSGSWINFVVFEAKSKSGSNLGNNKLLSQLTSKVKMMGLKVDQSALAFKQNGQIKFYGDKNLVNYLSHSGILRWTHKMNL